MISKIKSFQFTKYLKSLSIILLFTLFTVLTFYNGGRVYADHTLPHCREQYSEQVPEIVVETCREKVREMCAQYLPNQEVAYQQCLYGEAPAGGNSNPAEAGGASSGSTILEGFEQPNAVDCGDPNVKCCNNEVTIAIDVGCPEDAENPILGYLTGIINFLAAGVGLVVTAMIITGGIQYITATGVPQKLEAARNRITNALIALITYIFIYAILQWLIPGGLF